MNVDRPPGETGRELIGVEALAAIDLAFRRVPSRHLTLADLSVRRDRRRILLRATFAQGPASDVTVSLSRRWATVLWQQLGKALGR